MNLLKYQDLVEMRIITNRETLKRWIDQNEFPKPIRLGPNTIAWDEAEVKQWLESRKEQN